MLPKRNREEKKSILPKSKQSYPNRDSITFSEDIKDDNANEKKVISKNFNRELNKALQSSTDKQAKLYLSDLEKALIHVILESGLPEYDYAKGQFNALYKKLTKDIIIKHSEDLKELIPEYISDKQNKLSSDEFKSPSKKRTKDSLEKNIEALNQFIS